MVLTLYISWVSQQDARHFNKVLGDLSSLAGQDSNQHSQFGFALTLANLQHVCSAFTALKAAILHASRGLVCTHSVQLISEPDLWSPSSLRGYLFLRLPPLRWPTTHIPAALAALNSDLCHLFDCFAQTVVRKSSCGWWWETSHILCFSLGLQSQSAYHLLPEISCFIFFCLLFVSLQWEGLSGTAYSILAERRTSWFLIKTPTIKSVNFGFQ